jgi:hypothetical protein
VQVVKAAVDVVQVLVVINVEVVVVVRLIKVKVVNVIELAAKNRSCSILGATPELVQAETTNNKQTITIFILVFPLVSKIELCQENRAAMCWDVKLIHYLYQISSTLNIFYLRIWMKRDQFFLGKKRLRIN